MENNERPIGFENESRDCTVRALSLAGNIPYEKVHSVMKEHGRRMRCGFVIEKHIQDVCRELKLNAKQVKRSGTVKKFLTKYPKGNFFVIKYNHAFTVIDGVAHGEKKELSHIKGAWLITKDII